MKTRVGGRNISLYQAYIALGAVYKWRHTILDIPWHTAYNGKTGNAHSIRHKGVSVPWAKSKTTKAYFQSFSTRTEGGDGDERHGCHDGGGGEEVEGKTENEGINKIYEQKLRTKVTNKSYEQKLRTKVTNKSYEQKLRTKVPNNKFLLK